MGLGVVGLEPDRLAEFGDGLGQLPLVRPGRCRGCVGLGVVGLEPDRLAECGDRLVAASPGRQGEAEVVVGLGDVGLEPDRLAEFGDGLVALPLAARAMPRLMWASARSGWSRIASRNSATASSTLPLVAQGGAEVGVGLGVVGLEPDGLAEFGDGLVELPLAVRALPRLCGPGESGLSRIASRNSATASSSFPWAERCRG